MNTIIEKSDLNIVMLPHIYKDNSDTRYFNSLKAKCIDHDRVFVLEDNPDSDLYQFIISRQNALFYLDCTKHFFNK
jgi:hypothetical protein